MQVGVLPSISSNTTTSSLFVCAGSLPDSILGSLPSGGNYVYSYEWLKSNDSIFWDTTLCIAVSYQPDTAIEKAFFKRIIKSGLHGCCVDTSNISSINIHNLPTLILENFNDSLCLGSNYNLNLTLTGKKPFSVYLANGNDTTLYPGVKSDTLPVHPNIASTYNYKVISLSDSNNCVAKDISGNGILKVFKVPV